MILVMAAYGNQGKLLLPKLLTAGVEVRGFVNSEKSAVALREIGVQEIVVGDICDYATMTKAVIGVDQIYHIGPTAHPDERGMGIAMVDAARQAGVKHFIFSSVLHAISTGLIQHEYKRDIEEHLVSSGVPFTILQPANYMTPFELLPAFQHGVYRQGWSVDKRQSLVDLDDVTDVLVTIITNCSVHLGATYELCAPGWHTAQDLANAIENVTGKTIGVEEISADDWVRVWFGDIDLATIPHEATVLRRISAFYGAHDHVGNDNVLRWLLNRAPVDFEKYVAKQYTKYLEGASLDRSL